MTLRKPSSGQGRNLQTKRLERVMARGGMPTPPAQGENDDESGPHEIGTKLVSRNRVRPSACPPVVPVLHTQAFSSRPCRAVAPRHFATYAGSEAQPWEGAVRGDSLLPLAAERTLTSLSERPTDGRPTAVNLQANGRHLPM